MTASKRFLEAMIEAPESLNQASRKMIRLDTHVHVIPPRSRDMERLDGIEWTSSGWLRVDGVEMATPELYDVQALIGWMDAQGVEQAWISIPPTLYRPALASDNARRWSDAVNTGLAAVAERAPRRLAPLFHLPMQHPALAAEVASEATAIGHARFAMPAGSAEHGLTFSDPQYEPLWTTLGRARAYLFLHPSRGCDPRLDRFHLHNLLGGPTETALAAAHLVMSGMVERHPDITVCLAHGGGATAAVAGRLQRGQSTGRSGLPTEGDKVRKGLRRFSIDCITHDAAALQLAAITHGAEHVLFGSDWPFVMGLPDPHQQLADVDPTLLQGIFVDNPERLMRAMGKGHEEP
jgi:aminocarboxymuconate-semialdehyde decarboxylase